MTESEATIRRSGMTRFASRGFARLAYETSGDGDRVIVLLHDLLTDRASLGRVRDRLAADGFWVLAPDLRGHGASAAIPGIRFSIAELVLDLLAILDAEAVARASVAGFGFGAEVALDLALVEPGRIERLLLVDPFLPGLPRDDPDPEISAAAAMAREQANKIADLANKGSLDRALDLFNGPRLGSRWRDELPRARLGAMRRHANAFGPLLTAAYDYRPTLASLPRDLMSPVIVQTPALPEPDRPGVDRLRAMLPAATAETVADMAKVADLVRNLAHDESA